MKRGLLIAIGFVLAGSSVWLYGNGVWTQTLQIPEEGVLVQIASGDSLTKVLAHAESQGWLRDSWMIGLVARLRGLDARIQAGEYRVLPEDTADGLIERLIQGRVFQHTVTLPEGITLNRALEILWSHAALQKTLTSAEDSALLALVGDYGSAEGWFLPETWSFTRGETDLDVLGRAHTALAELLEDAWRDHSEGLPFASPYEALILASIVERETAVADERSQIAGVFIRRLLLGMRLQTDPTVIYGLGESYRGNLTRAHLRDRNNLFNTYQHAGLPPTPIALPGRDALRAVFAPDQSDTLYFVARGDGTHVFSADLEEHESNVRRYQLSPRADYRSTP